CPVLLHTSIFFLTLCRPPTSTLFPYTTLFRSGRQRRYGVIGLAHAHRHRYRDAAVDCLRRADRDHAVISTGRQTSRVDRNRNVSAAAWTATGSDAQPVSSRRRCDTHGRRPGEVARSVETGIDGTLRRSGDARD